MTEEWPKRGADDWSKRSADNWPKRSVDNWPKRGGLTFRTLGIIFAAAAFGIWLVLGAPR